VDIWRQDWETTIPQLSGSTVSEIQGVGPGGDAGLCFYYLRCNLGWYRFFVDEGMLVWSPVAPDPEDDLTDGENYADIISQFNLPTPLILSHIEMKDGRLVLQFGDEIMLEFSSDAETGATAVQSRILD
jgi:hypothetical protein